MSTMGEGEVVPQKQTRVQISCVSVKVTRGGVSKYAKKIRTSYVHGPMGHPCFVDVIF